MRKLYFFIISLTALSGFAQLGGLGVYKFLDLPVPARTAALGGNTISIKDDDVTLSFQNPALLTKTCSNQFAFAYVDYFGDIKYGYTSYAKHFDKVGTLSAGMQFVNYGTFQSADEYGNINGTFKAADYSFNLTYAKETKDSAFSFGATLKTIYSKYERYSSVGNAIDLGGTYHNHKYNFTVALVARNIGVQWKSYSGGGREQLDRVYQLGISKKIPKAPFRLSVTYQYLNKWDLTYSDPANPVATTDPFTGAPIPQHKFNNWMDKLGRHTIFGAEIIITKNFNLRLGYNYMRLKDMKLPDKKSWGGLTFGMGLKIYKFHISYAYAVYHIASGSNHFTMTMRFDEFKKKTKPAAQTPLITEPGK